MRADAGCGPPPDERFMRRAIDVALEGRRAGDYALGAVVVQDGRIVAESHTKMKTSSDPTAHAEMLAIRSAADALHTSRLRDCILYSTLEPCPMCTAAAVAARMRMIVFGASLEEALQRGGEYRDGVYFSWRQIPVKSEFIASRGDPRVSVVGEVLHDECAALLPQSGVQR